MGALYMAAGLGPEPPLTYTSRLHEHDAAAQADTRDFDLNWVPNDNPSKPHRHLGTPGSGSISDPAIV
jgi:hypothetical protein